jgi:hypothetical protein
MSNRQRIDPLTPPTIDAAQAAIANLTAKRDVLVTRGQELATIRASVAFKALSEGDATSRRKLDEINRESVVHDHELASIDAALVTARQRLEAAQRHEARMADRAKAEALRAALKQFCDHAAGVDSALDVLVESSIGLEQSLREMHQCGSAFPSDAQLLSLGSRVLLGALSRTTFRREFAAVPPLERNRSMVAIARQWAETIERNIAQRLGDQANETIEAAE